MALLDAEIMDNGSLVTPIVNSVPNTSNISAYVSRYVMAMYSTIRGIAHEFFLEIDEKHYMSEKELRGRIEALASSNGKTTYRYKGWRNEESDLFISDPNRFL